MNYPQVFHSDRAFCPWQFARQVHAHTLPLEWSRLEVKGSSQQLPLGFASPWICNTQSNSSFQSFSSSTLSYPWADGIECLYLEQCLAIPEINTFPNSSLTFPSLVQLQRWVDSQSPGLRRDHHPMQTSTIQCGSKMLLAAATPVANQDLLDLQTP